MARSPQLLLMLNINLAGGTGTYCRLLAAGLRRYFPGEFRPALLLLNDQGVVPSDHELFAPLQVLGGGPTGGLRPAGALRDLLRVRRAVRRLNPDILLPVHTYANLLASFCGTRPVFLTVHGAMTPLLAESRARPLISPLIRWRYARRPIIVPADGVADDLRKNFGATNLTVIPHGIDASAIRQQADQPIDEPLPGRPFFLAAGRLAPQKDYPTLLHAMALAVNKGLQLDLVILGDGPDRIGLESLARQLDLTSRVHFLGHSANPFPWMKRAQFFVLSSVWEGFGLVLLEAMALGRPCVAADCPAGPAEILANGEFGLLVPMRDPQALANAFLQLAHDPALANHLSRQSTRRAEQLSLRHMAGLYRDLFTPTASPAL